MFTCVPEDSSHVIGGQVHEFYQQFGDMYYTSDKIKVADLIDLQNNINEAIPKPTIYKIDTNQKENENEFNF